MIKLGFIYKVTNNINGKSYIGQTTLPIEIRFKQHLVDSKREQKCSRPFYEAINKYGSDNFKLSLIEEVDNSLLNEREKFWIQHDKTYVGFPNCNGYNATLGGDSTITYDYKIIVKDYLITKSKTQTAKNFNCCIQTVERAMKSFGIETINNSAGRKVEAIDSDGNVFTFESIQQAAQFIAKEQNRESQTVRKRINKVLIHCPEQKAYGFMWKFI